MTSSILSPRRLLALCSPITHVMASATLLLPQPFGPTIAVTPLSKASSERSENDLKPLISRRSRCINHHPHFGLQIAHCGTRPWRDAILSDGFRTRTPTPAISGLGYQANATALPAPSLHFRALRSAAAPGQESGRESNKAYLLWQAQSRATSDCGRLPQLVVSR